MQHRMLVPNAAIAVVGAALVATILWTGCSSEGKTAETTAQVSGTVTAKGRPVDSGMITLLNSGVSWQATLDKGGKFQISTPLPPGTYLVYLRSVNGGTHPSVPGKYQSDTSTDCTVSLKPGNNDLAIDLK
ncbi:MAG: carboxypeptidase-like regulatory domain-containing protein [Thermoguttaceae bacterium]